MQKTKFFFPLTKVDAVQRLVYGRITSETVDKANEIFDYDSSKPHFEKWSQGIAKAAAAIGAVSLGNVRAMHGATAAGKLVDLVFDDVAKTIDCCAKIVDDAEWAKVLAGVYTGFSMGGAYVKRWADPADPTKKRFTANPAEVSIVDNPCVTDAHFSMIKADGIVEEVDFKIWTPDNAAVANKAVEMAVAAGKTAEDFDGFIEAARESLVAEKSAEAIGEVEEEAPAAGDPPAEVVKDAPVEGEAQAEPVVEGDAEPVDKGAPVVSDEDVNADLKQVQGWTTPDGTHFATKAEARKHWLAVKTIELSGSPLALAIAQAKKAAFPAVTVETSGETFSPSAMADEAEALGKALEQLGKAARDKLAKGLWTVSALAEAIARLVGVCRDSAWEAKHENDSSAVPNTIAGAIAQLGGALIAMAKEEIAEALTELSQDVPDIVEVWSADVVYVELAAAATMVKADTALMEKVGARNSKKDAATIQATHDHMMSLGAKCAAPSKADEAGELAKVAAERDDLAKQVADAIPEIQNFGKLLGDAQAEMAKMRTELDAVKAAPAPMPQLAAGTSAVGKGADNGGVATGATMDREKAIEFMKSLPPQGLQSLMLDLAFANPISVATNS